MTSKLFSELGLSAESLQAVEKLGFEQASPIQAEAIPVLMSGKDVVGQSQTGSGKTAAFGIPAIEKIDPQLREAQVLILCPTRELAVQVSEEIRKLALFKHGILTLPIYGGQSYERQFYGLQQGAQIIIGTPGRLLDHLRRGTLRLDKIKMAILDEADVMLNMGFRDDIELILQSVPKERQTVFFSATMPQPIRDLIEKYSHEPQTVRISQKSMTVPTVEQIYYEVDRRNKMELLTRLIDLYDIKLGIVFCNTKRMVDDLVDYLEAAGYQADRLHGDMTQNMRDRVMNKFRQSGLEFLVATDVAARGIDVDDVEVVFNYDLPYDAEDYVHRIGRTGRAGKSGRAISLVPYRELFQIRNIERFANVRIQRGRIPTVDEVAEARENVFLEKLRSQLTTGGFPSYEHLMTKLNDEGFSSTDIVSVLVHQLQSGEGARHQAPKEESEPAPRPERERRSGDRRERGPRDEGRPDRYGDRRERAPREPRSPRFDERRERPVTRVAKPVARPDKPVARATKPAVQTDKPAAHADKPVVHADKPVAYADKPVIHTDVRVIPTAVPVVHADKPVAEPVHAVENTPAPEATKPTTEKTFSDAEILSSVPNPALPAPPKQFAKSKPKPAAPAVRPKPSRATPQGQTRLWMNLGDVQGIKPIDVVNAVAGETGLPGKVVGTVDVREKHLFVDVASRTWPWCPR